MKSLNCVQNEACSVPITAIACLNETYVAGVGNSLRLIDDAYHTLVDIKVFDYQAVHGIIVDNAPAQGGEITLLIWGSRNVRLARARPRLEKLEISLGPVIEASDWILDARFDTSKNDLLEQKSEEVADNHVRAALITAHNSLIELNWAPSKPFQPHATPSSHGTIAKEISSSQPSLTELTAASRCILYSANLIWLSRTRIMVAAGTVFGEIVVWSCNTNRGKDGCNVEAATHNVFIGHEGSVFGVRISPLVEISPTRGLQRLLASCSDDRTIRIWEIAGMDASDDSIVPHEAVDKLQDRVTGFGTLPDLISRKFSANNAQVAWSWGHASRIWNVHFLQPRMSIETGDSAFSLASFGEDATCQFWSLSRGGDGQLVLRLVCTSDQHAGKNIWSSAVMHKADGSINVITGGADGSIISHKLPDTSASKNYPNIHEEWALADISKTMVIHSSCEEKLSSPGTDFGASHFKQDDISSSPETDDRDAEWVQFPLKPNDMLREYTFVHPSAFITTTKAGTLLLGAPELRDPWGARDNIEAKKTMVKWLRVMDFDDLRSDSILSKSCTSHPLSCSFVGSRTGVIYNYDGNSDLTSKVAKVDGKVSGLFLDRVQFGIVDSRTASQILSLTVTTGGGRYLHNFLSKSYQRNKDYMEYSHSKLLLPPGFAVTYIKHVYIDTQHEALFAGSRNAGIAIYSIRRPRGLCTSEGLLPPIESSGEPLPTLVLPNVHGKEAITSILWLPDTIGRAGAKQHSNSGHLFSSGRDGTCTVHHLVIDYDSVSSILIHKTALPFGPYIEGLLIDSQTNHLLLWGFRNKHFVLWDETSAEETMRIECGGAHRNWAFFPANRGRGGMFVWTKANVCNIYQQQQPLHQTIEQGGHGREIKAVAVAPTPFLEGKSKKHLLATGAEDTDIRIFAYDPAVSVALSQKGTFRFLRVLRKHNTGIQYLRWSKDGQYLFSSGGSEELFVWRIRYAPVIGIAVVCESILPFQSKTPDLRITSFEVQSYGETQGETSTNVDANTNTIFVACAYSDSTVRVYKYQSNDGGNTWQYLHTGAYGPNHTCLTQCRFLPPSDTLLTAGGDGSVAFWNFGDFSQSGKTMRCTDDKDAQPTPQTYGSRHMIHQSSIKALTKHRLDCNTTLLLTGGDDNALAISIIRSTNTKQKSTLKQPNLENLLSENGAKRISISTVLIPRAHAAAITAVAVLAVAPGPVSQGGSEGTTRKLYAVTSGNDQRIKTWQLSIDLAAPGVEGVQVKKLANKSTGVADLADIALLAPFTDEHDASSEGGSRAQTNFESGAGLRLVVCGVGMEVWDAFGIEQSTESKHITNEGCHNMKARSTAGCRSV